MEKTKILAVDAFTGEIKAQKVITRRKNGTIRVATVNNLPSRVDQQYFDDTDINLIMKRYEKTGIITHFSSKTPIYADVSELPDLLTASNIVHDARTKFENLPARVRERFANDPNRMIAFLQNPNNRDEAEKLGLLKAVPNKNDELNDENLKQQKTTTKKTESQKKPDQE